MITRWLAGGLLISLVGSFTAVAQGTEPTLPSNAPIMTATAQLHAKVNGAGIPYSVQWSETVLSGDGGRPEATLSAISYVREGLAPDTNRPVIFAFNGGPGASSSPLQFGLLGPRRRADDHAKGTSDFVDNQETLLDVADLVFIDPVGTGLSRELQPKGFNTYWDPERDAYAVEMQIRAWLRDHHRTESPVYVIGESYGGYRLALISKDIADLNIAGLVLISPLLDRSGTGGVGNDQPFIFDLPSMAVTAFYHHKYAGSDQTAKQVFDHAQAFAQTDYAEALQQGSALPADQRAAVAKRVANFIGLPVAYIAEQNLRIDSQEFLEHLVPGQVVGRIDTRVVGPVPRAVPGRPKGADDPALGAHGANVILSRSIGEFLKHTVGVKTDLNYVSLNLNAAFEFDWRSDSPKSEDNAYFNVTPDIAELMNKRPQTRLLLMGGYYDLATPLLSQRYAITHGGVPLNRTTVIEFPSAHTVYDDDHDRERTSDVLHRFVAKVLGPVPETH